MRLAVLDIGSNSAQLQVVELAVGAPPLPAHAVKEPTLLAEELQLDGRLSEAGIARVTAAVGRAVDAAVRLGVDQLYPFVTAAVRDAVNRDEVIDRIEAASGSGRSTSRASRRRG
jgi:exopolyphosphatase / guanosine-5'-triphosphate,3'-diphosphate pyrophosphatase